MSTMTKAADRGIRPVGSVIVASGAAASAAVWYHLAQGVTISLGACILLLPVWWATLSRYRGATPLVVVGLLAMVSGLLLGAFEPSREVSTSLMQAQVLDFAAFVGSIGLLLWCRTQIGAGQTVMWFGAGSLVSSVLIGIDDVNPWKFSLSIPVALIFLGVATMLQSRMLEIVVPSGLAAVSLVSDSRSMTAFFVLVIPVVFWQMAANEVRGRVRPLRILLWFGALALGAYNLFLSLILEGVLGEAAQQRTQAQIDISGSLILGGRPEAGATVALVDRHPLGYGAGVLPSSSDIWAAKAGMSVLGYDPNNGYVERYMFGTQFEVHSVLGDVWIRFGLPAAVFMLLLLAMSASGVIGALAVRQVQGVVVYLFLLGAWNIFFSPALPSYPFLALLVALVMRQRVPSLTQGGRVEKSRMNFKRG